MILSAFWPFIAWMESTTFLGYGKQKHEIRPECSGLLEAESVMKRICHLLYRKWSKIMYFCPENDPFTRLGLTGNNSSSFLYFTPILNWCQVRRLDWIIVPRVLADFQREISKFQLFLGIRINLKWPIIIIVKPTVAEPKPLDVMPG